MVEYIKALISHNRNKKEGTHLEYPPRLVRLC